MPWNPTEPPPNDPPNGSTGGPPGGPPRGGPPQPPNPWGPGPTPPARPDPGRDDNVRPGPWTPGGQPPRGPQSGEVDALIGRVRETVQRFRSGGGGNGGGPGGRGPGFRPRMPDGLPNWSPVKIGGLAACALVLLWLAGGIYRVQPDELGVVQRFGAYDRTTPPGLNYHLPWPVETVQTPAVTHINRLEIGYRSSANNALAPVRQTGRDASGRDVLEESLMLTGDENIIDIDVTVFWRISSPEKYLFSSRYPEDVVKAVAESAMREVIGKTPIQPALTDRRAAIEQDVQKESQTIADAYQIGLEVVQVQLQKVDPPAQVVDSFRDVQRANTDAERARNEAESYRNDIIPRARGESAQIVAGAEAARAASVAEATGQTQRFAQVYGAYKAAPDVTLRRMYIETMQDVLKKSPTVVVDPSLKGLLPVFGATTADAVAGGAAK